MVSDQPSWGRRCNHCEHKAETVSFRPTLVGSEVCDSEFLIESSQRFRPTLVGSEEDVSGLAWDYRGFQTNPRGVGGTATVAGKRASRRFQTNPRGVGGITTKTGKKS